MLNYSTVRSLKREESEREELSHDEIDGLVRGNEARAEGLAATSILAGVEGPIIHSKSY